MYKCTDIYTNDNMHRDTPTLTFFTWNMVHFSVTLLFRVLHDASTAPSEMLKEQLVLYGSIDALMRCTSTSESVHASSPVGCVTSDVKRKMSGIMPPSMEPTLTSTRLSVFLSITLPKTTTAVQQAISAKRPGKRQQQESAAYSQALVRCCSLSG